MQENFFVKYARLITIISLIGILFCIILIVIVSLSKEYSKNTYLTLQFAPSHAILTLDSGTELRTGTYEFQPGHYTGTITAENFTPKVIDFEVTSRGTTSVTDYIVHSSEGLPYFEKSAANISTLRLIDDTDVKSFLEAYDYKVSLFNTLPVTVSWLKRPNDYPTYNLKITDGRKHAKCQSTLCLLTIGPKENYDQVKQKLTELGYNIEDYEVYYELSY